MKLQLTVVFLAFSGAANAGLTVTDTNNGTTLTNNILGSGIVVSNINVVGSATQSGTFTGGLSAGIGIDKGIILTSGDAQGAVGPNTQDGHTGAGPSTAGDADLDALIPQSTNDANILEFDFTTTSGNLFFNYVFASEEYNEFVNSSFNDVFALFVDGNNIAIAPDGSTVSINNVNCGNPYNSAHVGDNCNYFNNNDINDGGPFFDIGYDGFTDAFTASILGLSAGTHTMKFAIADAGDSALDSAIFIESSSFTDTNPNGNIPEPAMLALFGVGLFGLGFGRRKKSKI